MVISELKKWINSLPEDFDEYLVVSAEFGSLDEEMVYRLDKTFISLQVDEDNKEVFFEVEKTPKTKNNRIKRFGD